MPPATHGLGCYFGSGQIIPNAADTPAWFQRRQQEKEDLGCAAELHAAQQCIGQHRFQNEECYHRLDALTACREGLWRGRFPDSWPAEEPKPAGAPGSAA
eukprot:EG_transcript_35169